MRPIQLAEIDRRQQKWWHNSRLLPHSSLPFIMWHPRTAGNSQCSYPDLRLSAANSDLYIASRTPLWPRHTKARPRKSSNGQISRRSCPSARLSVASASWLTGVNTVINTVFRLLRQPRHDVRTLDLDSILIFSHFLRLAHRKAQNIRSALAYVVPWHWGSIGALISGTLSCSSRIRSVAYRKTAAKDQSPCSIHARSSTIIGSSALYHSHHRI